MKPSPEKLMKHFILAIILLAQAPKNRRPVQLSRRVELASPLSHLPLDID
jgi:hypothetical protein